MFEMKAEWSFSVCVWCLGFFMNWDFLNFEPNLIKEHVAPTLLASNRELSKTNKRKPAQQMSGLWILRTSRYTSSQININCLLTTTDCK